MAASDVEKQLTDFVLLFATESGLRNLPAFLQQSGTYDTLRNIISLIEVQNPSKYVVRYLLRGCEQNFSQYISYELVTRELCCTIVRLLHILPGVHMPVDMGAGLGLLTAVINLELQTHKSPLRVQAVEPFHKSPWYHYSLSTLPPRDVFLSDIQTATISEWLQETNRGNTVILSWLHPSMSQESKLLFADPHIHHIIHIGEPIEFQTCINEQFFDLLVSCGFEYTRIPVKTISQPDYFVEDELHKRLWEKGQVMCRSEIQLFSRRRSFSEEVVQKEFGPWLASPRVKLEGEEEQYSWYLARFSPPPSHLLKLIREN